MSALLFIIAVVFLLLANIELVAPHLFMSLQSIFSQSLPDLWEYDAHISIGYIVGAGILLFFSYKQDKKTFLHFFEVASRFGLAILFLAAAVHKVQYPMIFAVLVAQYQFLPEVFVYPFALFLPVAEVLAAILLLFGPNVKVGGKFILLMMCAFIIALASAVYRELGIACGCFTIEGAQTEREAMISLIRDIILLPSCIFMAFRARDVSLIKLFRNPYLARN
jgi:hypothetical protein